MCLFRKKLIQQRDFYQKRFGEVLQQYDNEQKKNAQLELEIRQLKDEMKTAEEKNKALLEENQKLSDENLAKHNIIVEERGKMKNLQKKYERLQKGEQPHTRVKADGKRPARTNQERDEDNFGHKMPEE